MNFTPCFSAVPAAKHLAVRDHWNLIIGAKHLTKPKIFTDHGLTDQG